MLGFLIDTVEDLDELRDEAGGENQITLGVPIDRVADVRKPTGSTPNYAAFDVRFALMYIIMYTGGVSKQYSIADARRNLPTVVDEAASGSEVQLTRRGRPVAVVVSIEEYERLKAQRTTFAKAYESFRRKFPEGGGIAAKYFRSVRDRGRGRAVDL